MAICCVNNVISIDIVNSDGDFIDVEAGLAENIENMDKMAHGGAVCSGNLQACGGIFEEDFLNSRGNFLLCELSAGESNATICAYFKQHIIAFSCFARQTFGPRQIEIEHADLALEFSLNDEKNEQNGQNIEHGHDRNALQYRFAGVDIHGLL